MKFVIVSLAVVCLMQNVASEENSVNSAEFSLHVESSGPVLTNKTESPSTLNSRRTQNRARPWTLQTSPPPNSSPETPKAENYVKNNISETEMVHEKWRVFEKSMKKVIDGRMKKALPMFLRMGSDAKLSGECSKSIMALVTGIRGLKSWAFRMLDASTKFPSGILDGTLSDFGDYDECINIVKEDNKKRVQFTGQYCVVEASPLLPSMPHRVQFKTVVLDVSNFSQPDSVSNSF
ncbi:NRF domain-containing protein [Nephila pilipes]|uniref:NRF domain-containing protein n=1 Tax=Nephila pilipes TaxID=299642 RepID=A0A8X6U9V8_NEPPI|nr:NRF domain-containing protein [Nephila pilipes]